MSLIDLAAYDENGDLTPRARATDDALANFYKALTEIPKDEIIRRLNQENDRLDRERENANKR